MLLKSFSYSQLQEGFCEKQTSGGDGVVIYQYSNNFKCVNNM